MPVKLLGISSVECLAAEAQLKGCFGKVNIVIDAQRNELCLARYEISPDGYHEIRPLKLATLEEVRAILRWRNDCRSRCESLVQREAGVFPSAASLGRLAATRTDFVSGEKLEPIYLRETNFVKAPPLRVLPKA